MKSTAGKGTKTRTEIAAKVTPGVVLIRAQGRTLGNYESISFQASYKQSGGLFGSSQNINNNGKFQVSPFGQVQGTENGEFLPFALDTVPELIIQPLDSTSQNEWNQKRITSLQKQKSSVESSRGVSRFGPPQIKREVFESIPAIEEVSFKLKKEEDGK